MMWTVWNRCHSKLCLITTFGLIIKLGIEPKDRLWGFNASPLFWYFGLGWLLQFVWPNKKLYQLMREWAEEEAKQ